MSASSITARQGEVARARELMGSLTTEEWAAASGCTGWSVQDVKFEGPAAGQYTVAPGNEHWTVTPGLDRAFPTAITSAHSFVSWGTKRADWRDSVTVQGDADAAAATLDALNII